MTSFFLRRRIVLRASLSSGKLDSCFAGRKSDGEGVSGDGGGSVGSKGMASLSSLKLESAMSGTFGR